MYRNQPDSMLPVEALNLFNDLIVNLIDVTEKYSLSHIPSIQEPKSSSTADFTLLESLDATTPKNEPVQVPPVTSLDGSSKTAKKPSRESTEQPSPTPFDHSSLVSDAPKPLVKCARFSTSNRKPLPNETLYNVRENKISEWVDGRLVSKPIIDFDNIESSGSADSAEKPVVSVPVKMSEIMKGISSSSRRFRRKVSKNNQKKAALKQKYKCCDETSLSNSNRMQAGKDPVVDYGKMQSFFMMQNTPSVSVTSAPPPSRTKSTRIEQNAFLTTKRLANNRQGCELTFSTLDAESNPIVIRAVCPDFEPRRVWLNGKPLDYIDSESQDPILSGLDIRAIFEEQQREAQSAAGRARRDEGKSACSCCQTESGRLEDSESCDCDECEPRMKAGRDNDSIPCDCAECKAERAVAAGSGSEQGDDTSTCDCSECATDSTAVSTDFTCSSCAFPDTDASDVSI